MDLCFENQQLITIFLWTSTTQCVLIAFLDFFFLISKLSYPYGAYNIFSNQFPLVFSAKRISMIFFWGYARGVS